MKREQYPATQSSSYKIYVSGIPPETSTKAVIDYFGCFGGVALFDPEDGSMATSSLQAMSYKTTALMKNFCILQCQDKSTYWSIINRKHVLEQGRVFYCEPYKHGLSLIIKNNNTNKRRCFVRKVPFRVTQTELARYLEEVAGAVESVIRYPSKFANERTSKHCSFSATFFEQSSLSRLLILYEASEGLFIYGQAVIIEKYDTRKANGTKSRNLINQVCQIQDSSQIIADSVPSEPTRQNKDSQPLPQVRVMSSTLQSLTHISRRVDINTKDFMTKPNVHKYFLLTSDLGPTKNHDFANIRINVVTHKQ